MSNAASSAGIASAVPSSTRTVGQLRSSAARIAGTGSTPVIRAPVCTMSSVNFPVPAPSSRTSRPSAIPSSRTR